MVLCGCLKKKDHVLPNPLLAQLRVRLPLDWTVLLCGPEDLAMRRQAQELRYGSGTVWNFPMKQHNCVVVPSNNPHSGLRGGWFMMDFHAARERQSTRKLKLHLGLDLEIGFLSILNIVMHCQ